MLSSRIPPDAGIDSLVNVFTWNGYGGFVTVPERYL